MCSDIYISYISLRPLRNAAVPGTTLDIVLQDELTPDAGSKQQQPKPIVTLGTATSTVKRNPAYGDELAALENYNHIDPPSDFALEGNPAYKGPGRTLDDKTHINKPSTATAGRNPAYGDELAALENYNHIDRPNTSAHGPQRIPDSPTDTDHASSNKTQEPLPSGIKSGPRAPQLYPDASRQDAASSEQLGHAQFQRGKQYETGLGGVRRDFGQALRFYLEAAKQGHIEAPYNIAQLYEYGRGVSKSESIAVQWYIKAAEMGHLRSQTELGYRYTQGKGVPRDLSEAFEWRLLAAEQGDGNSQLLIAHQYGSGQGVQMDKTKALEWHFKAAEQGYPEAQFVLGEYYGDGSSGVPRDYLKSLEWYLKAAEHNHWFAEVKVGDIYRLGLGVPVDESKAMKWYSRAADQGSTSGRENLENLKKDIRNRQRQTTIAA